MSLPTVVVRTDAHEPGFYVADSFAATLEAAIVSGPYDSPAAADRALNDCNIAGDCDVVEVRAAVDLHAVDRAADRALETAGPSEAHRRLCLLFPDVDPDTVAERIAAAVIDRQEG